MIKTIEYKLMKEFKRISDRIFEENNKCFGSNNFVALAAFITNASFACEVGLKNILEQNNCKTGKAYCHNLKLMFNDLKDYQKEYIQNHMDQVSNYKNAGDDFQELLEVVSNNFNDWRYFYEVKDRKGNQKEYKTNYLFLYDLLNALVALWEK